MSFYWLSFVSKNILLIFLLLNISLNRQVVQDVLFYRKLVEHMLHVLLFNTKTLI